MSASAKARFAYAQGPSSLGDTLAVLDSQLLTQARREFGKLRQDNYWELEVCSAQCGYEELNGIARRYFEQLVLESVSPQSLVVVALCGSGAANGEPKVRSARVEDGMQLRALIGTHRAQRHGVATWEDRPTSAAPGPRRNAPATGALVLEVDGKRYATTKPRAFGRDPGPGGLVVSGRGVSRVHGTLYREGGRWVLADNASSNGTSVNGVELGGSPVALHAKDRIVLCSKAPASEQHLVTVISVAKEN